MVTCGGGAALLRWAMNMNGVACPFFFFLIQRRPAFFFLFHWQWGAALLLLAVCLLGWCWLVWLELRHGGVSAFLSDV